MNAKQLIAFVAVLGASASAFSQSLPHPGLSGDAGLTSVTARTIVIAPDTKYVNVTGGETVRFVVGGKSFVCNFDGPAIAPFNLDRSAPPGMLDHKVTVYVAPNPLYFG